MPRSYAEVKDEMKNLAKKQGTQGLIDGLALLDIKGRANHTREERMTWTVIIEVLEERHPEVDEAFAQWAEADSAAEDSPAPAIIAAAKAAAAKKGAQA